MAKGILVLLVVAVITQSALAQASSAQSASWDYKARERSQQATSAGVTYLTKGMVDQAVSSLFQATRSDSKDPLPYALLGLALDMKRRYAEGLDALHQSYRLAPRVTESELSRGLNTEIVLSIGVSHYLMHNYDKAAKAWRKALELNPSLCHIHANLGYAYIRKGDFNRAMEHFRKLVNCHPNSQVAYQGMATAKYLIGDFDGARQAAEQSQSIAPYPPVLFLLAKLDYLQGDRSRGDRRVQEYIKLTRKPWKQREMTSIGYPSQHDFRWDPYAVDDFDNVYLLSARVLNLPKEASRQRSLTRQGKSQALAESAKAALSIAPEDFYVLRELGLLLLAEGQYSDAAEKFKEVLQLCPGCSVDLLHLGRALSLDGKTAEASAQVRAFQRSHPGQRLAPVFAEIARVDPGLAAPSNTSAAPPETAKNDGPDDGF